jgi:hypothetical protein
VCDAVVKFRPEEREREDHDHRIHYTIGFVNFFIGGGWFLSSSILDLEKQVGLICLIPRPPFHYTWCCFSAIKEHSGTLLSIDKCCLKDNFNFFHPTGAELMICNLFHKFPKWITTLD